MLTRIEIDGFKTFEHFELDVSPFLVVVGSNASGKSNLFDAIQLLARLAEVDIHAAAKNLRGEPRELFRRNPKGDPCDRMKLAVEVLLNPEVRDPWGSRVKLGHTRIRYEVEIERRDTSEGVERLAIVSEAATPILRKDERPEWRGTNVAKSFREAYLQYSRIVPWLETTLDGEKSVFEIRQDGKAGRKRPAQAAEATVLSSITSGEFPHLFALREEMRSWRLLQLDPTALRKPSPTTAPEVLQPDGSNLAAVLARIQSQTRTPERERGVIADIAADLGSVVPGVVDVLIAEDRRDREYRLKIAMRDQEPFNARVVSDGTLRVLALLTMLHDPKHGGLVCFEEPENGVHPARLRALITCLRELVTEIGSDPGKPPPPLSQMLLNSHSPVVLSGLESSNMVFADIVTHLDPEKGTTGFRTRMRRVAADDQGSFLPPEAASFVTRYEVQHYLESAVPAMETP